MAARWGLLLLLTLVAFESAEPMQLSKSVEVLNDHQRPSELPAPEKRTTLLKLAKEVGSARRAVQQAFSETREDEEQEKRVMKHFERDLAAQETAKHLLAKLSAQVQNDLPDIQRARVDLSGPEQQEGAGVFSRPNESSNAQIVPAKQSATAPKKAAILHVAAPEQAEGGGLFVKRHVTQADVVAFKTQVRNKLEAAEVKLGQDEKVLKRDQSGAKAADDREKLVDELVSEQKEVSQDKTKLHKVQKDLAADLDHAAKLAAGAPAKNATVQAEKRAQAEAVEVLATTSHELKKDTKLASGMQKAGQKSVERMVGETARLKRKAVHQLKEDTAGLKSALQERTRLDHLKGKLVKNLKDLRREKLNLKESQHGLQRAAEIEAAAQLSAARVDAAAPPAAKSKPVAAKPPAPVRKAAPPAAKSIRAPPAAKSKPVAAKPPAPVRKAAHPAAKSIKAAPPAAKSNKAAPPAVKSKPLAAKPKASDSRRQQLARKAEQKAQDTAAWEQNQKDAHQLAVEQAQIEKDADAHANPASKPGFAAQAENAAEQVVAREKAEKEAAAKQAPKINANARVKATAPAAPKQAAAPTAPKQSAAPATPSQAAAAHKQAVTPAAPTAPKQATAPAAAKQSAAPATPSQAAATHKQAVTPAASTAPKQATAPTAPKQSAAPPTPSQAAATHKQAVTPAAPKQAVTPAAPKQSAAPAAPKQSGQAAAPAAKIGAQSSTVPSGDQYLLKEASAEEALIHAAEAEGLSEHTKAAVTTYLQKSKAAELKLQAREFQSQHRQNSRDMGESRMVRHLEQKAVRGMKFAVAHVNSLGGSAPARTKLKAAVQDGEAVIGELSSQGKYVRAAQTLSEVLKAQKVLKTRAIASDLSSAASRNSSMANTTAEAKSDPPTKGPVKENSSTSPFDFYKSLRVMKQQSKTQGEEHAKMSFLIAEAKNEERFLDSALARHNPSGAAAQRAVAESLRVSKENSFELVTRDILDGVNHLKEQVSVHETTKN